MKVINPVHHNVFQCSPNIMDPDFLDSDSDDDAGLAVMLQRFGMSARYLQSRLENFVEDDRKIDTLVVSEETRRLQADIYESVVRGDPEDYTFLAENKCLLDQVLFIDCRPGCNCVRTFESHPLRIEDTSTDRLSRPLEWIKTGKCSCLQNSEHPMPRRCGKTLAHVASVMGNLKMLMFLQEQECTFNYVTPVLHYTPLFLAVMKNHIHIAQYLLAQGVNINIRSKMEQHSPLIEAMLDKKKEIFDMLVQSDAIDVNTTNFRGESALIVATRMENVEYVEALMKAGARPDAMDVRGTTALMHACRLGFVDIAKLLLKLKASVDVKDARGDTALQFAVYREEAELVDLLLTGGADPNHIPEDGFPALVVAAYSDSWQILELLLKHGADIAATNRHGYTALHIAAWNGHVNSVNLLLKQRAPCDTKTADLNTPLSLAAHGRHSEIIEILIPHGCDVNNSDKDQDTPLHYASYNSDVNAVRILVQNGANPNVRNRVNVTPLWNATYCGSTDIIKILLSKNVDMEVESVGINQHHQSDDVLYIYKQVKTPLWVAANRNFPEVGMLLIAAGYDMSGENWILTDALQEIPEEAFRSLLHYHKTTPSRLVKICRRFLRQYFGNNVTTCSNQLEIPVVLKNYLQLKDLTDEN
ncbi:ankyrin-1-like isoform X1 [Haliotis asinina]|uniref:ankyrin-1-like isoform X1 n=2 Tax=Haliotis asinina TaxID=109174 RepID=UPI0035318814